MSMDQQYVSYSIIYSLIITFYLWNIIRKSYKLVGSLKSLYTGLIFEGILSPKILVIMCDQRISIGSSTKQGVYLQIKVAYLIQKATKINLYRELFQLVGQEIELGFTSEKLPNRDQLVNTLYLVSPNHQYFKQQNFNMLRGFSFQDIQKLKDLNTSMYRSKRLRIFKVLLKNFKRRKQRKSFSKWKRQRHNWRKEQKSKQK